MPIYLERMVVSPVPPDLRAEVDLVSQLADELRDYMVGISDQIDEAHRPDAQSSSIQTLVGAWLESREFEQEYLHAFIETPGTRSRPDFYRNLGNGRGILAEIERGGAVNNNHDLKDVWKCHLSERTHHLFLMVPNRNFKRDGARREAPFTRCKARLATFFQSRRTQVDMISLSLFGYGPEDLDLGDQPPADLLEDAL